MWPHCNHNKKRHVKGYHSTENVVSQVLRRSNVNVCVFTLVYVSLYIGNSSHSILVKCNWILKINRTNYHINNEEISKPKSANVMYQPILYTLSTFESAIIHVSLDYTD